MDVRCEKCQTEYELDESRLKPGGVTVKCTNCGHMFKIRKRANTNVGVPAAAAAAVAEAPRTKAASKQPPPQLPAARALPARESTSPAEPPVNIADMPSGPTSSAAGERQWIVRMENGETKSCKELATLQQWIVAGVVSRESLISRSGKTWKRLGDIPELAQYFVIADEARNVRATKPTGKPTGQVAATVMGMGGSRPQGPEDDLDRRTTGSYQRPPRTPTPPPPPPQRAAASASAPKVSAMAQTELAPPSGPVSAPRPVTAAAEPTPAPAKPSVPAGSATAAWAKAGDVKTSESMAAMPQGPRGGKLSAGPDEPAFAGKIRVQPSDDAAFRSGQMRSGLDDEEDVYKPQRGSRAGMWIAFVSLLLIGGAVGVVYMFVFKAKNNVAQTPATGDAGAATAGDASTLVVTPIDASAEVAAPSGLDGAKAELLAGVAVRMKASLDGLAGKDDPASLAMRARLSTAMAQAMNDRAPFVDKAEGDKARKAAKQLVVDTAPLAQRALGGQADSASANLAMADIMRLQGKPAPAVKRYIDTARTKAGSDPELLASVALADALVAIRDGNLPQAEKLLSAIDAPDDMRIKIARAQIAFAQNKPVDAKAFVDQILATQPEHDVALAFYKKLETIVAKDDPLPPEDGPGSAAKPPGGGTGSATKPPGGGGGGGGGGDYDSLLARANKLAETSCAKAMDLYSKALEQKSNGVEALTGMGYCHLDAKQFSSAFSKFRAALAVSARFEPALAGVAETYQRQGNKESAIEAWKAVLEAYPGSAKAKKQLEILGASPDGGGEKKPEGGGEKKPEGGGEPKPEGGGTPPTPPAGDGSASG
jgi:predicted Zn finger-like uncharacterized protein